jgi:F-type H+-transporting ATPase subunit gamma
MKMVSAAKLKGDEMRLQAAKPFNAWASKLCSEPQTMEPGVTTFEELPNKVLIVPFTSDKGLCGGVNSFITRCAKDCIRKLRAAGKDCDVVVFGDKGRAQLRREYGNKIVRSATDAVSPGTFSLACALTSELIAAGATEYDAVVLMYNSYVNAAVYKQMYKVITPFVSQTETGESLAEYEFDSDKAEAIADLYEYMLASQVFHSFMDGAASEQSSRMTAMENASKNANEMIGSLTLRYNRARQARITTELIEIISGASALDEA